MSSAARNSPPLTAVRGSGFRTTALPSASAGATLRIARMPGKLKGEITPTTPTGTCCARLSRGFAERRMRPVGASARAAAWCSSLATSPTSNAALPCPEPASPTSHLRVLVRVLLEQHARGAEHAGAVVER